MDFKAQLEADLDIFINPDEFAQNVTINGVQKNAIFDEEHEVLDGDEVIGISPALIVKKEDAKSIKDDDTVVVGAKEYYVADKIYENDIEIILLRK